MVKANKQFDLENAVNFRELGGYKTNDGRITKNKVYIRGGKTSELSDSDIRKLLDYGLSLEIDLRSKTESEDEPSILKDKVEYKSFNMLDGLASMKESNKMPKSMYEVYKNLLDTGQDDYKEIFKSFLENNGVSLFHCSIGKDRTGVLALLILDLANVPAETIIIDYAVSEKNLASTLKKQAAALKRQTGQEIPLHFLESKEKDMKKTIDYLYDNYGNAREYLKKSGLTDKELDRLNSKFIS